MDSLSRPFVLLLSLISWRMALTSLVNGIRRVPFLGNNLEQSGIKFSQIDIEYAPFHFKLKFKPINYDRRLLLIQVLSPEAKKYIGKRKVLQKLRSLVVGS
jgi:hypothetical protein